MGFEMSPNQEKKQIKDAKNIDELLLILDSIGEVQGSERNFNSEQLKDIIKKVQKGELDINYITRTEGLRDKVEELLNKKCATEIQNAQSFEELYKILKSNFGIEGSHRHYSAEELIKKIEEYRKSGFERILQEITRAEGLRDKVEALYQNK